MATYKSQGTYVTLHSRYLAALFVHANSNTTLKWTPKYRNVIEVQSCYQCYIVTECGQWFFLISDNQLHINGEWWCIMPQLFSQIISIVLFNQYQGVIRNTHFNLSWSMIFFKYDKTERKYTWLNIHHYLRHRMLSTRQPSTPGHD